MKGGGQKQFDADIPHQIIGWALFVSGACLFIAASLKNRDSLALIGSMVFLVACMVFLLPIFRA